MSAEKTTCQSDRHQHHMCRLQAMGATADIARLSSRPTVEWAKADSAENICTPVKVWQEEQLS
ncbi:MAG TPA: hypothetical protein VK187_06075 [Geobacteraceae bacterium]|nr:hypothetical protein [Geobacteraceae bacterium]